MSYFVKYPSIYGQERGGELVRDDQVSLKAVSRLRLLENSSDDAKCMKLWISPNRLWSKFCGSASVRVVPQFV